MPNENSTYKSYRKGYEKGLCEFFGRGHGCRHGKLCDHAHSYDELNIPQSPWARKWVYAMMYCGSWHRKTVPRYSQQSLDSTYWLPESSRLDSSADWNTWLSPVSTYVWPESSPHDSPAEWTTWRSGTGGTDETVECPSW